MWVNCGPIDAPIWKPGRVNRETDKGIFAVLLDEQPGNKIINGVRVGFNGSLSDPSEPAPRTGRF